MDLVLRESVNKWKLRPLCVHRTLAYTRDDISWSEKVMDNSVLDWDNEPSIWGNTWWGLMCHIILSSRHFYVLVLPELHRNTLRDTYCCYFTERKNWALETGNLTGSPSTAMASRRVRHAPRRHPHLPTVFQQFWELPTPNTK